MSEKITAITLDKAKLEDFQLELHNKDLFKSSLEKYTEHLFKAETVLAKAKSDQKITETTLKVTRQKYIDNLASELAKTLTEDAPCPVCGSTHHPKLKTPINSESIDVDSAEKANEASLAKVNNLEHAYLEVKNKLEAKNTESQENIVKIAKKCQELNLDPNLFENSKQIDALIAEKQSLVAMLKKWQKEYQDLKTSVTQTESEFNNAAKNKANYSIEFEDSKTVLKDKFIEHGFGVDIKIAQTSFLAAKKTKIEIDQLKQDISSFSNSLASAKDRLKRANNAVEGLVLPDILELEKIEKEAFVLLQTAHESYVLKEENFKTKQALALEIEKLDKTLARIEEKYNTASSLFSTANGTKGAKITFSSFVLQTILSDVLKTANSRLNIMSRGRYRLNRTSEVYDGRKKSGLNIEITDSFTGIARPVKTLSGGEIFLASLSLALGLSDVVQSYAGGVKLDTILVDEGFGSLDTESLDSAIQTLTDLQKSGRLVGIISHVAELRERIQVRLEITPTKKGSIAKFHV